MKAVFNSLTFPYFFDPATGVMCERKGRVKAVPSSRAAEEGGVEGRPLPHCVSTPSSESVCCPCVSICWPSRKLRACPVRNWIWVRPSSIPCASFCGTHWKRVFFLVGPTLDSAMLLMLIRAKALGGQELCRAWVLENRWCFTWLSFLHNGYLHFINT